MASQNICAKTSGKNTGMPRILTTCLGSGGSMTRDMVAPSGAAEWMQKTISCHVCAKWPPIRPRLASTLSSSRDGLMNAGTAAQIARVPDCFLLPQLAGDMAEDDAWPCVGEMMTEPKPRALI